MKKTFLKIGLLISCLFTVGCNTIKNGKFYTLADAYSYGFFGRDALLNIAYNWNGGKNINDEDFIPKPASLDDLDEITIRSIKESHAKRLRIRFNDDSMEIDLDYIDILFLGEYNNCYVVRLRNPRYEIVDPLPPIDVTIDGVTFLQFFDGYPNGIDVWKEV